MNFLLFSWLYSDCEIVGWGMQEYNNTDSYPDSVRAASIQGKLILIISVAEPEPGAEEPPYFAVAGAVIFVKVFRFSSPFLSKIDPVKPSQVKNRRWGKNMSSFS